MLKTLTVFALGAGLLAYATAARADACEDACNNGYNVCTKQCTGAGCYDTCSKGRSGCLKKCKPSGN